jgi:hypothetical protein
VLACNCNCVCVIGMARAASYATILLVEVESSVGETSFLSIETPSAVSKAVVIFSTYLTKAGV